MKIMDKIIIVINGKARVGKDTLCDFVIKNYYADKISSITPIINIARDNGWDGVKDKKSRRFLSELKRVFIDYNDLPNKYLLEECSDFFESNNDILFVQIREKDQINEFINCIRDKCVCCTLVINNNEEPGNVLIGNDSDDLAYDYPYDFRYFNQKKTINEAEDDFMSFFRKLLVNKGVNPRKKKGQV